MRILFIAQAESIHTAHWLALVKSIYPEAQVSVISSTPFGCHPTVGSLGTYHDNGSCLPPYVDAYWESLFHNTRTPWSASVARVAQVIRDGHFDIIHVHAIQEAAYLLSDALESGALTNGKRPRMVLTVMGSDLYYFGRIPAHYAQICKALRWFDCVEADTQRDIALARHIGYSGETIPGSQLPYTFSMLSHYRNAALAEAALPATTSRNSLFLKGTVPVLGRSFMALAALKLVPPALKKDLTIKVVGYKPVDLMAAAESLGVKSIEFLPFLDRERLFRELALSRIVVSLNKSDGTPKLFLEAAFMGAYPIFSSDTGLAPFGRPQAAGISNICLVNPDDIRDIAGALTLALDPSSALQEAADLNQELVKALTDDRLIVQTLQKLYQR